jgi:hypothetical protein
MFRLCFAGLAAGLVTMVSPTAACAEEWLALPISRFNLGGAYAFEAEKVNFVADVTGGAQFLPRLESADTVRGLYFGELGFSYEARGYKAFNLAGGIGFGNLYFGLAYHPRLLIGDLNEELAVGMRNSAILHGFFDMLSLEFAHQMLDGPKVLEHDLRVMLGLNPGPIIWLLVNLTADQR